MNISIAADIRKLIPLKMIIDISPNTPYKKPPRIGPNKLDNPLI